MKKSMIYISSIIVGIVLILTSLVYYIFNQNHAPFVPDEVIAMESQLKEVIEENESKHKLQEELFNKYGFSTQYYNYAENVSEDYAKENQLQNDIEQYYADNGTFNIFTTDIPYLIIAGLILIIISTVLLIRNGKSQALAQG